MSESVFRILVVDDEPHIRSGLAKALANDTCAVETAGDVDEALQLFAAEPHHLVITDVRMPGTLSGIDLVKRIREERPETTVLVITAHAAIDSAVEAMRGGAHDYITKPLNLALLRLQVNNAIAHHRLVEENLSLRDRLREAGEVPEIIGRSAAMRGVLTSIRQVADTDVTVLIEGESGVGKELAAQAIHRLSPRRDRPFIAANVGALPESLVESELFGYEKGAFSGAARRKPGWFEMAHTGTLFLDEIGEMTPKTQVDLLRVLEQRELRRLGGEENVSVDVRVLAATHRDLEELVAAGRFRQDLYYRLAVVPIRVPPLRERRDDIPILAEFFLAQARRRHGRGPTQIAGAAMKVLCDCPWPGNVRQLRNCMERLSVTHEAAAVHADDLPGELRAVPRRDVVTLDDAVAEAEKAAILAALDRTNQHREKAAHLLGVSVRTLHYKMNRHALQ